MRMLHYLKLLPIGGGGGVGGGGGELSYSNPNCVVCSREKSRAQTKTLKIQKYGGGQLLREHFRRTRKSISISD